MDGSPSLVDGKNLEFGEGLSRASYAVYRAAWRRFERFCVARNLDSLPASHGALEAFFTQAEIDSSTASAIEQAIVAIERRHRAANAPIDSAKIAELRRSLRSKTTDPRRRSPIQKPASVAKMLAVLGDDAAARRDRLILLLGFCGGLKRSELVDLDLEKIDFRTGGIGIRLTTGLHLKLDDIDDDRLAYSAVLRDWIDAARLVSVFENGVERTPIFRGIDRSGSIRRNRISGETIRLIVRDRAREARISFKESGDNAFRFGPVIDVEAVARHMPAAKLRKSSPGAAKPISMPVAAGGRLPRFEFDDRELRTAMQETESVVNRVAAKLSGGATPNGNSKAGGK